MDCVKGSLGFSALVFSLVFLSGLASVKAQDQKEALSPGLLSFSANVSKVESLSSSATVLTMLTGDQTKVVGWKTLDEYPGWKIVGESKSSYLVDSLKVHSEFVNYAVIDGIADVVAYSSTHTYDGEVAYTLDNTNNRGAIDFALSNEKLPMVYTPYAGAGHLLHTFEGVVGGVNLVDFVVSRGAERLEGETYRAIDIDTRRDGDLGYYDAIFELDPSAGYWPRYIQLVEKFEGRETPAKRIESSDFVEIDGVWIPKKITFFTMIGGKREPSWHLLIEPKSIQINPQLSEDMFKIDFPSNVRYFDFRDNSEHGPPPTKTNATPVQGSGKTSLYFWALILFPVVLFGWLMHKRRAVRLLLPMLCTLGVGCSSELVGGLTAPNKIDVDVEPGSLVSEVVEYQLLNQSKVKKTIGKPQASCGCTNVSVDRRMLEPGESLTVTANFKLPHLDAEKIVQIFIPYGEDPNVGLATAVRFNPTGDWSLGQSSIRLHGLPGAKAKSRMLIRRGHPDLVVHLEPADEISLSSANNRYLIFERQLPQEIGISENKIKVASNGAPKHWDVSVITEVLSPVLWKPRAASISEADQIAEVSLTIAESYEFIKFRCPDSFAANVVDTPTFTPTADGEGWTTLPVKISVDADSKLKSGRIVAEVVSKNGRMFEASILVVLQPDKQPSSVRRGGLSNGAAS